MKIPPFSVSGQPFVFGKSGFRSLLVPPASPGAFSLAPITMANTLTLGYPEAFATVTFHDGVDGDLIEAPIVHDALGQPYVLKSPGVYAKMTPEFDGEDYGAMVNPYVVTQGDDLRAGTRTQGFTPIFENTTEEITGSSRAGFVKASMISLFDSALQAPEWIDCGTPQTLSKLKMRPEIIARTDNAHFGGVAARANLTIIDCEDTAAYSDRPFEDFFPIAESVPVKTAPYHMGLLDMSVFRSDVPLPSGAPTPATAISLWPEIPLTRWGWGGENLRPVDFWRPAGTTYSATRAVDLCRALINLHADIDPTDKLELTKRVVASGVALAQEFAYQIEIDRLRHGFGAGQWAGYTTPMIIAGFALQSQDILDVAKEVLSILNGQNQFVREADVGHVPSWADFTGTNTWSRRRPTIQDYHVGRTWFTGNGGKGTSRSDVSMNVGYLVSASGAAWAETVPMALLQNGQHHPDGVDAILHMRGGNGGKTDANRMVSLFWHLDQFAPAVPLRVSTANTYQPTWWRELWETARPLMDVPLQPYPPHQPVLSSSSQNSTYLTTGDGAFSWANLDHFHYSRAARTQVDLRYSQDQISFVQLDDVADSGTETGLTGQKHFVQVRSWNEHGASEWSPNFSVGNADKGERMVVTTTDSGADRAPTFVQAPALFTRRAPLTPEPNFAPAPSTLPEGVISVVVGQGYIDAKPAVDLVEARVLVGGEPETDWRDITALEDRDFVLGDFAGQTIEIEVRATNSEGSATATAGECTVPALPVFPADVILDTDFGQTAPFIWPDTLASAVPDNNCTIELRPNANLTYSLDGEDEDDADGETGGLVVELPQGAVLGQKTGGNPRFDINLAADRPLEAGKKYLVELGVPLNRVQEWSVTRPAFVTLGSAAGGEQYLARDDGYLDMVPSPNAALVRIPVEVDGAETNLGLWARFGISDSSGGSNGPSPQVGYARVVEVEDFDPALFPPPDLPSPVVIYDMAQDGVDIMTEAEWRRDVLLSDGPVAAWTRADNWDETVFTIQRDDAESVDDEAIFQISGLEVGVTYEIEVTRTRIAGTLRRTIGRPAIPSLALPGGELSQNASLYLDSSSDASTGVRTNTFRYRLAPRADLEATTGLRVSLTALNGGEFTVSDLKIRQITGFVEE